jgi:ribonuclease HII
MPLDYSKTEYELGVDEVGRGCLFGPVVSAAVVMPLSFADDDVLWKEIKDSKKLSEKKRHVLETYIKENAICYGIGECSSYEIDKINILQASLRSMHRAINIAYRQNPIFTKILVDGNHFKPFMPPNSESECIPHECIEGGDNIKLNIAAASILAKCHRDRIIQNGCEEYKIWNEYDLKKNKGYGTAKHLEALKRLGPIEGHRFTYRPVYLCNKSKEP